MYKYFEYTTNSWVNGFLSPLHGKNSVECRPGQWVKICKRLLAGNGWDKLSTGREKVYQVVQPSQISGLDLKYYIVSLVNRRNYLKIFIKIRTPDSKYSLYHRHHHQPIQSIVRSFIRNIYITDINLNS